MRLRLRCKSPAPLVLLFLLLLLLLLLRLVLFSFLLLLLLLLLPGQPPSSRTFLQIIQAILLHLLQRFERSSPALPILSGV